MPPEPVSQQKPDKARPLIRASSLADAEEINALQNLPLVRAGTLRLPNAPISETRRSLENPAPGTMNLVAVLDGHIVGSSGINRFSGRRAHACGLGIGIHDDYQGKGIGTALMHEMIDAADNWLDIRRIELTVFTDNAAAIRLYEKFSFVKEGIFRDFAFRNGRYTDVLAMARIRNSE